MDFTIKRRLIRQTASREDPLELIALDHTLFDQSFNLFEFYSTQRDYFHLLSFAIFVNLFEYRG